VKLPDTFYTNDEIESLLEVLKYEYTGGDYDLLRRNCCHFADDFCQRLGVGRIPGWLYRLARIGARIDFVLVPMHAALLRPIPPGPAAGQIRRALGPSPQAAALRDAAPALETLS